MFRLYSYFLVHASPRELGNLVLTCLHPVATFSSCRSSIMSEEALLLSFLPGQTPNLMESSISFSVESLLSLTLTFFGVGGASPMLATSLLPFSEETICFRVFLLSFHGECRTMLANTFFSSTHGRETQLKTTYRD